MKKILLMIGIVFIISLVQAQEEPFLGDSGEIPAPYPQGEGYITLPPEDIISEEVLVYKADPNGNDILETVAVDPEELFGNDYEEVILVNESERETFPPGGYEIVRSSLAENKSRWNLLTKIVVAVIIIGVVIWLLISRFRR